MPIVRVKTKFQVTLPTALRTQMGVKVGDLLEANVEKGKMTLVPKTVIDRGIAESLEDYKSGRSYGPFDSAEELLISLHRNLKRSKTKPSPRSRL
jgi:AbrB family looped-hinge helix DNA binding protein